MKYSRVWGSRRRRRLGARDSSRPPFQPGEETGERKAAHGERSDRQRDLTFRQHLVHGDLVPADAEDPADVAAARAAAAAAAAAGARPGPGATLLPARVEELLHVSGGGGCRRRGRCRCQVPSPSWLLPRPLTGGPGPLTWRGRAEPRCSPGTHTCKTTRDNGVAALPPRGPSASPDPQRPCSVPRRGWRVPPCTPQGRRAQPHRVTAGAGCRQGPGPASLPGGVTGGHRARQGQGPTPPPPPAGPIRPGNGPSQEVPAAVRSTAPAPPPAAGPGPAAPGSPRPGLSRPAPRRSGMSRPAVSRPAALGAPPAPRCGERRRGGSAGWRRGARHAGGGSSPSPAEAVPWGGGDYKSRHAARRRPAGGAVPAGP